MNKVQLQKFAEKKATDVYLEALYRFQSDVEAIVNFLGDKIGGAVRAANMSDDSRIKTIYLTVAREIARNRDVLVSIEV